MEKERENKKVKIKALKNFLIFFLLCFLVVQTSSAHAAVLLSDSFSGAVIDTDQWSEVDSGGIGGTTGNIQQDNGLFISGSNTPATNILSSLKTFDRRLGDITIEADVASNGCSLFTGYGQFIYGVGFGDPAAGYYSGESYTVSTNGGSAGLYYLRNGGSVNSPAGAFSCTDNQFFHIKLVILQAGGAKVYLNNSSAPYLAISDGTFSTGKVFLQHVSAGSMSTYKNITVTQGAVSDITPTPGLTSGIRTFYIDNISGSDSNDGRSPATAWQTVVKVTNTVFQPGDSIYFKRGGVWGGNLSVYGSGTSTAPITFGSYGTGGAPQIKNQNGGVWANAIDIYGDWIVIKDFLLTDTNQFAVQIRNGGDYNTIQDIECTRVGTCVAVSGRYNLVTRVYAHDLKMVVNDVGGDNDFGANGFAFYNSNNELSYSRCINCIAPSYDYGTDGGFIEIYGSVSDSSIHHNYAERTNGFLEIGGSAAETVRNIAISHNLVKDSTVSFSCIHTNGNFGINAQNIVIEHNTVQALSPEGYVLLGCMSQENQNSISFRNNIFHSPFRISDTNLFTHTNNIYKIASPGLLGNLLLGATELNTDPLFVNSSADDFSLQATSPAVDTGAFMVATSDYAGNPIYGFPDIGAYEYQPPYKMGINRIATGIPIRVYGDEKYKGLGTISPIGNANFSADLIGTDTTKWLDITLNVWDTAITGQKTWTVSSGAMNVPSATYSIGDLSPNTAYNLSINDINAQNAITGVSCNAEVCTSDNSGKIIFSHNGAYPGTYIFSVAKSGGTTVYRTGIVTARVLHVRAAPGGAVIGKVNRGTTGIILAEQSGWFKMRFLTGLEGWVSAYYIAL